MEYEEIYEILYRIQNTRELIKGGNIEQAEQVLENLENDIRRVIYP